MPGGSDAAGVPGTGFGLLPALLRSPHRLTGPAETGIFVGGATASSAADSAESSPRSRFRERESGLSSLRRRSSNSCSRRASLGEAPGRPAATPRRGRIPCNSLLISREASFKSSKRFRQPRLNSDMLPYLLSGSLARHLLRTSQRPGGA